MSEIVVRDMDELKKIIEHSDDETIFQIVIGGDEDDGEK